MTMILGYALSILLVAGLLFAVVWFVFGRGEELAPLDDDLTVTELPRAGITGADVRAVRFGLVFRGYRPSEVDWTLEKLAREIDELRAVTDALRERAEPPAGGGSVGGPVS
ncbi:MAG: DivIVA domain-containing protein [Gordonia sp. (in: high G+C Gram-positive bacteria)]|uniref:DivIVA domain-containing protein n=1 Tax=Gordonia sp. (in: high G+C Gram-positive bacteria) TaxID=84139 RepID=UPI0039E3AB6A